MYFYLSSDYIRRNRLTLVLYSTRANFLSNQPLIHFSLDCGAGAIKAQQDDPPGISALDWGRIDNRINKRTIAVERHTKLNCDRGKCP
jgi:hypothetical protein